MKKHLVFLTASALAAMCNVVLAGQVEPAMGLNDDLGLSQSELARLKLAAASGDSSAGRRVAMYFELAAKDVPVAIDWYKVAAENGDRSSACRLAIAYKDDADVILRARGAFWKRRCDWMDKEPQK
jgi:TPR repeat protein